MAESKQKKLPNFVSTQEIVDFFETNDMGEYENELSEVHFDVDIKDKHYLISVDRDLMSQLLEIARGQQVSVEMLVDSWLKEKLVKAS